MHETYSDQEKQVEKINTPSALKLLYKLFVNDQKHENPQYNSIDDAWPIANNFPLVISPSQ